MQETEIIRELIINQIECNDCCACNTPTYEGNYIVCQEHKGKNIDNLEKALSALDQLETKLNGDKCKGFIIHCGCNIFERTDGSQYVLHKCNPNGKTIEYAGN